MMNSRLLTDEFWDRLLEHVADQVEDSLWIDTELSLQDRIISHWQVLSHVEDEINENK